MTVSPQIGTMVQRSQGEGVAVYRLFDATGCLLYVGVSQDPMQRWWQHRAAAWWADVASYAVTWHVDRPEAERVEMLAIQSEDPVHNDHGTPKLAQKIRAGLWTDAGRKAHLDGIARYQARRRARAAGR